MHVAYGPPGHRGVTSLMAVGAVQDDYATKTEQAVKVGAWVSGAILGLGLLTGSRTLRSWGVGGTLALLAVRAVASRA